MRAPQGSLTPFAEGVWLDSDPIRIVGMPLTATMTVLRLADDRLLLHSPVAMTAKRRADVSALGVVAHLYSPNLFHHLWIGKWAAAFPAARVHAPAGLARKRRDLRVDRVHGSGMDPEFGEILQEVPIRGFRLQETALIYLPARTAVVADLVHNIGRPLDRWTRIYAGAMGFYDRVALSRLIRWTAFSDRAAARRSIDDLLGRPFDRLVVGHGAPLASDARAAMARAYAWLLRAA